MIFLGNFLAAKSRHEAGSIKVKARSSIVIWKRRLTWGLTPESPLFLFYGRVRLKVVSWA